MQTKPLEDKVNRLIAGDLAAMGYELVRAQLMPGGSYMTLQVMAERADGKSMTVNDCTQISHAIAAKLDADEKLKDRYTLEVSSPGIDRPLVKLKDFERFTGCMARVELSAAPEGEPRRFEGNITRITRSGADGEIEFHTDAGDIRVGMNSIARAKLVLTDALMKTQATTKH